MTERDLFLIYRTHKIMIATGAHESIHRMLSVLRLSSKWKRGFLRIGSAHNEMSMKFVSKKKKKKKKKERKKNN